VSSSANVQFFPPRGLRTETLQIFPASCFPYHGLTVPPTFPPPPLGSFFPFFFLSTPTISDRGKALFLPVFLTMSLLPRSPPEHPRPLLSVRSDSQSAADLCRSVQPFVDVRTGYLLFLIFAPSSVFFSEFLKTTLLRLRRPPVFTSSSTNARHRAVRSHKPAFRMFPIYLLEFWPFRMLRIFSSGHFLSFGEFVFCVASFLLSFFLVLPWPLPLLTLFRRAF